MNSISIAKGIGIMMVVLGHCIATEQSLINRFIYQFHMPLFFFISGYCLNDKYFSNIKLFCKRKFKGLYIPNLKYNFIFLLLHNAFISLYIIGGEKIDLLVFCKKLAQTILFMEGTEQLLGGFWFLKQLIIASILGLIILKVIRIRIVQLLILIIPAIVFSYYNFSIPYLFWGSQTFLATLFYIIGYHYKDICFKYNLSTIIFCFVIVLFGAILWPTGIVINDCMYVLPYIISAMAGIIMVMEFSKIINTQKSYANMFSFIGNHTLTILTWHFLSFKIVSFIAILYYKFPINTLISFPVINALVNNVIWIGLYFIVGITLPLTIVYINKFISNSNLINNIRNIK